MSKKQDADDGSGKKDMDEGQETPVANKRKKQHADIYDCFDKFKETEQLDEQNMWYCKKCGEHR